MPSKDKDQSLKQKTLLGFLSKQPGEPKPNTSSVRSVEASSKPAESRGTKLDATPASKSVHKSTKGHDTPSSSPADACPSGSKNAHSNPLTSAPDVTMISDGENDQEVVLSSKVSRKRRKLLLDDELSSEEDIKPVSSTAFAEKLTGFRRPQGKRARTSSAPTTSDHDTIPSDAYSKKGDSLSRASDSDAFVLSDEEAPRPIGNRKGRPTSVKSRTSSRAPSDNDVFSDGFIVSDDDEVPKSSKAKPKGRTEAKSRPSLPSANSSNNNFLTAAEQRALNAKTTKQANEESYSFLLERRDKDGNRPGDAKFDPRTLYIPKDAWKSFTPFEKQFWTIKQDQYDTVLFFQKGKFYELYESDAEIGHTEFDLKLTDRVKMKMVGVPEMSFDFWAAKFLARGYKVGRVDQVETSLGAEMRVAKKGGPKSGPKEIVRRELGKILTNGTLVDPNMLTDDQAGHLISIREEEDGSNQFGLCILDASTGEFNLCEFTDDVCGSRLETIIRQLRPKEVLYTKGNLSVGTTRSLKSLLPGTCIWSPLRRAEGLGYDDTLAALKEMYPVSPDSMDNGNDPVPNAISSMMDKRMPMEALGAMIWYLRTLNLDKEMLTMKNFCIYDPMRRGKGLILDGQTLAHIEILRNSEGTEEGSLFSLLGNCITPFGKRLFRIWLCMPLQDVKAINERLDAVDDIMDNPTCEDAFTSLARGMPDLERIVSRIHAGSCKPRDFLNVLASFRKLNIGISKLADTAEGFESRSISGLLRAAPDLEPHLSHVESLFEEPQEETVDMLVPVEGKDKEYDQVQEEVRSLENKLDTELEYLKENVCSNIVYWHSSVGAKEIYLVQTPSSFKAVPKNWTKNNSTKNLVRWTVPELTPVIRQLKEARETRKSVISDFKLRLYTAFDDDRTVWLQAVKVMAELDCLFSLAKSSASMGQPSCRPEFVESDQAFLEFEQLRHLSIALKNDFIPNDVKLGGGAERIMLLTGPNMGGKSTAMRMTATGVIMAQLGMYVPARKARLSPVDAILTRMGAYDNMFSNSSTFKVEMDECCKILREATPRSLVILDELGRGTSTYDGMAIAGAVLHQLASHTLALSCFATHYSSLTDDYKYHPNIRNMHMNTIVDEANRKLIFTYKLTGGVASSSFGTHVASLAGVPSSVVDRAEAVSKDFAHQFQSKLAKKRLASTALPLTAQADFVYLFKTAMEVSTHQDTDNHQRLEVLRGLKTTAAKYVAA